MVTFQDDFNRTAELKAAGGIHTLNGWQVIGTGDVTNGIELINNYVTNATASEYARAFQTTSTAIAATGEQKVSAWMTANEEGSGSEIEIGIAGQVSAVAGSEDLGIWASLTWDSDGVRTLKIKHKLTDAEAGTQESAVTTLATLTMVAAGAVVQDNYYGRLLDDGATGTLQNVRFILTADNFGLKCAAYVNTDDDDRPTLEAYLRSDLAGPDTANPYGYWWFGFTAATTAQTLIVSEYSAADYTLPDRKDSVMKSSFPTFRELKQRTIRRWTGSSDISLDDFDLGEIINQEIEQLIQRLGDEAWFLIRREELTLTVDAQGYSTMPAYVKRPLLLEKPNVRVPASWQFAEFESDGDVVIRLNVFRDTTSDTYEVTFLQRFERMQNDEDRCVIPREYVDAIVMASCRTLAFIRDRSPALAQSYTQLAEERYLLMKKDQARFNRQRKVRLRPRRRATMMEPNNRTWRI